MNDEEALKILTNLTNAVKSLRISVDQLKAAGDKLEESTAALKRIKKPDLRIVEDNDV